VSVPLACLYVIYAGYRYISSQGSPEKTKAARAGMVAVITGIIVIILTYTLIRVTQSLGGVVTTQEGQSLTLVQRLNRIARGDITIIRDTGDGSFGNLYDPNAGGTGGTSGGGTTLEPFEKDLTDCPLTLPNGEKYCRANRVDGEGREKYCRDENNCLFREQFIAFKYCLTYSTFQNCQNLAGGVGLSWSSETTYPTFADRTGINYSYRTYPQLPSQDLSGKPKFCRLTTEGALQQPTSCLPYIALSNLENCLVTRRGELNQCRVEIGIYEGTTNSQQTGTPTSKAVTYCTSSRGLSQTQCKAEESTPPKTFTMNECRVIQEGQRLYCQNVAQTDSTGAPKPFPLNIPVC